MGLLHLILVSSEQFLGVTEEPPILIHRVHLEILAAPGSVRGLIHPYQVALYYSTNGVIGNVLPTLTNWHRYSTWVNYQVGVSTYGTYSTYVDGVPLYGSNSGITAAGGTPLVAIPGIDGSVTPSMSGTWAAPTVVSGSVNNGGMVLGAEAATYDTSSIYYTHNFADIYYDYTPARIEVTDGINVEIMCLTSWSSSAINYLFNKGALTTGAKRVLNVYNSSNVLVYSTYVAVA